MTTIKTINAAWLTDAADLDADSPFARYWAQRQDGATVKAAMAFSGLGYHDASLFEQRQRAVELGEVIDPLKMSDTQFGVWVREQRLNYQGAMDLGNKTGLSWAEISVRCGVGEAVCRRFFKQAANADHKGLRIGHGGRFCEDNASAYQGKAKAHGWIRPVDPANLDPELKRRALEIAGETADEDGMVADLSAQTVKDLRAQAKELGLKGYAKMGKDDLVLLIVTALAA